MAQTVTTPYAADWIPPQTLTGAELCRWMRRFRTTIRDLAQRLGITQRRIRECRRAGLGDGVWRVYRHSWCSMDCFLIDRPELFRQSR